MRPAAILAAAAERAAAGAAMGGRLVLCSPGVLAAARRWVCVRGGCTSALL
jgi:hypothetical protein